MKEAGSLGHEIVHFLQYPQKFITNDAHFLFGHFLDLDVPDHLGKTVPSVLFVLVLARDCFLDFAHF